MTGPHFGELPANLTRHDWDQKKPKVGADTGIGKQCDVLQHLHQSIDWGALDLPARARDVLGNWRFDNFTKQNWDKICSEAVHACFAIDGKFVPELVKMKGLCESAAVTFQKATFSSNQALIKHVTEMAHAANTMAVNLKKDVLVKHVDAQKKAWLATFVATYVTQTETSAGNVPTKHANLVHDMRQNPTPAFLNGAARTAIRDFTQPLGNIAKLGARGWGAANPDAARLFRDLTPFGDRTILVDANATQTEIDQVIDTIEPLLQEASHVLSTATFFVPRA